MTTYQYGHRPSRLARATLELLEEVLHAAERHGPEQMLSAVRRAMGTLDLTEEVQEAVREANRVVPVSRMVRATPNPPAVTRKPELSPPELYQRIRELISTRPMTLTELEEETGVTNRNRLSQTLVKLQRKGEHVLNLGTGRRALWFIAPKQQKR